MPNVIPDTYAPPFQSRPQPFYTTARSQIINPSDNPPPVTNAWTQVTLSRQVALYLPPRSIIFQAGDNPAPGQYALYPHFRADNWIYMQVRDTNAAHEYTTASDAALILE